MWKQEKLRAGVAKGRKPTDAGIREVFSAWLRSCRKTHALTTWHLYEKVAADYLRCVGNHAMSAWGTDRFRELRSAWSQQPTGMATPHGKRRGRFTKSKNPSSVYTQNMKLYALRGFQRWAASKPSQAKPYIPQPIEISLFPRPAIRVSLPTDVDIQLILAACANRKHNADRPERRRSWVCRERAVRTLLATGMTGMELFKLTRSNFILNYRKLILPIPQDARRKSAAPREVFLPTEFVEYARKELSENPRDVYWLDTGNGKAHYKSSHCLSGSLKAMQKELGLNARWHPVRGLRLKWMARQWEAGVEVPAIQRAIGHVDVYSTLNYLATIFPHIRRPHRPTGESLLRIPHANYGRPRRKPD